MFTKKSTTPDNGKPPKAFLDRGLLLVPMLLLGLSTPLHAAAEGLSSCDAARVALVEELDRVLSSSPLAESRVGAHVVSLATGEELYARGADTLLNPASNIKLVTAAAALEVLGPDYTFKTEIWVDSPPDASGVVEGNLYIKGFGDPSFVTERMVRLVLDLWNLGVRRVTGDVVVDETFFDGVREGPGWEQETSDRAYIAPVGAVSLNRNAVGIHVRPGSEVGARAEVTVDPSSAFFIVDNRVVTGSRRARLWHRPQSIAEGRRQRILVRGVHPIHFRPRVHWRRIDNPPYYFAHTFGVFMRQQGVRFNRWRIRTGRVPNAARLLHTSYSEPLATVIGPLNKLSSNHVAEMLIKTMGAEMRGEPGTWEKGVDVVAELLEEIGIERGSYVFLNGSGLNDVNRLSSRQMTTLLAHMWRRFQTSPEFVVSLPVSARDGTTRWRMEDAAGWVRAKTGTLENVSGLSGYVGTQEGEVLAFSLIVNDYPRPLRDVLTGIDRVPVKLAGFAGATDAGGSWPVPPGPPEVLTSVEERAALYLALHSAADPRNVRYLLRAIETEPDSLLRAVAADAVYQSDRGIGAFILLDEFEPSPEGLGRLRRLVRAGDSAFPVLSSISDLAGEGDSVAMSSLLRAADAAGGDEVLEAWFREALTEVGRAAPKELLAGLLEMDPSSGGDAIELIAAGLRFDAGEPPAPGLHPFREALREAGSVVTSASAPDCPDAAAAAAAAAALDERLERLIEGCGAGGEAEDDGSDEAGDRAPEGGQVESARPDATAFARGGRGE